MAVIKYVKTNEFFIEKYTLKRPQTNMHYHHAYELYYIIDGEREYFIGDKFFKVSKGDLVWVPKDVLHRTDGKGATRFLLFFKDSFIQRYLSAEAIDRLVSNKEFVYTPEPTLEDEFRNMFFELLREFNKTKDADGGYDDFIAARRLSEILYFIYSHENQYENMPSKLNDRMHLIIKYINDNFAYELSVQDMADRFGVTKNHFCHLFTQHMGVTFITYLNTVRIKAACDMIKKDQDTILEISSKCGFCSSHYFYRVFKKEKGLSPSEYRHQFRKK